MHHFTGKKHRKLAKAKEKDIQTALKAVEEQPEQNEEEVDNSLVNRKKLAHLEFLIQCYKENLTQTV